MACSASSALMSGGCYSASAPACASCLPRCESLGRHTLSSVMSMSECLWQKFMWSMFPVSPSVHSCFSQTEKPKERLCAQGRTRLSSVHGIPVVPIMFLGRRALPSSRYGVGRVHSHLATDVDRCPTTSWDSGVVIAKLRGHRPSFPFAGLD